MTAVDSIRRAERMRLINLTKSLSEYKDQVILYTMRKIEEENNGV